MLLIVGITAYTHYREHVDVRAVRAKLAPSSTIAIDMEPAPAPDITPVVPAPPQPPAPPKILVHELRHQVEPPRPPPKRESSIDDDWLELYLYGGADL